MSSRSGFTLVELLVVIFIIAVLTLAGLVYYVNAEKSARDGRRKQDVQTISQAMEMFYADNNHYPPAGSSGGYYWGQSAGSNSSLASDLALYFKTPIPHDPSQAGTANDYPLWSGASGYCVLAVLENSQAGNCNWPVSPTSCNFTATSTGGPYFCVQGTLGQ